MLVIVPEHMSDRMRRRDDWALTISDAVLVYLNVLSGVFLHMNIEGSQKASTGDSRGSTSHNSLDVNSSR